MCLHPGFATAPTLRVDGALAARRLLLSLRQADPGRFSFRVISTFHYNGEGWGITRTARELITSNGSATLTFRNPADFKETRHILVTDGAKPIPQLNELEYIPAHSGHPAEIYANIWHSDRIARISPPDGHVIGCIDLTGILPEDQTINAESVLNGIAYDAARDRIFVTGKQWPAIFEIKIVPRPSTTPAHRQSPSTARTIYLNQRGVCTPI